MGVVSRDRKVRYARLRDADVAYQVSGEASTDLLLIPGQLNHIESAASVPQLARHYARLADFARVVLYDKRGTGLSGPLPRRSPTIEDRVDEAVAVLDTAGSESAAVYATADGGPVGIVLAAIHPDRVRHLAIYGTSARLSAAPDYPEGIPAELMSPPVLDEAFQTWGDDDDPSAVEMILPSCAHEIGVRRALAAMERLAGTPRLAKQYFQVVIDTDVRDVLPMVRTPTLVLHARGDRLYPIEQGRYLARELLEARFVELPNEDHYYFWEDAGRVAARVADELETFITGRRAPPPTDRAFAIILFTDIVGSTPRLAELGDQAWRLLLERHDQLIRHVASEYTGRTIKNTGDGMLLAFDGPSRAIRCARRLVDALNAEGLSIRAGLHAGEVEWRGEDIAGIAVHIAARLCSLAEPGDVLCTSTMRDLTAGSGLTFLDRGRRNLRGVPGRWSILAVTS